MLDYNSLVYCTIDTNDRFKFVEEDAHRYCYKEINEETANTYV